GVARGGRALVRPLRAAAGADGRHLCQGREGGTGMSPWAKIKSVATFEFLSAVKRPGYLIATFGMPLFMAAYGAVVAVPAYIAEKGSRAPSVYGVVDEPGVLGLSGDLDAAKHSPIPEEMG